VSEVSGPFGTPRAILIDERGTALRITWHPVERLAVVSLWRDDRCIGTFRAAPADMAEVIRFLSTTLAGALAVVGDDISDTA
jgi:hypothetical protein